MVPLRRADRAWHRSTLQHCFNARWYSSTAQHRSANSSRRSSSIARSLVAQYSTSPSRETALNTRIGPNPCRWTTVPAGVDRQLRDGPIAPAVEVHLAVDLQLRQEGPAEVADLLEVLQAGIPAVEEDGPGAEPAALGRVDHGAEVVVLGQAVDGLVVDPVVQRQDAVAVGPDQADQVDAPDHRLVLARPVAMDRLDLLGVELVERGVVEDQDAVVLLDQRLDLAVEGLGVGLEPVEQPGVGVVGGRVAGRRLAPRGLAAAGRPRRGDQEVDVVGVAALGWLMGPS